VNKDFHKVNIPFCDVPYNAPSDEGIVHNYHYKTTVLTSIGHAVQTGSQNQQEL